jgi:trehalose 6-phosphate phosphatase
VMSPGRVPADDLARLAAGPRLLVIVDFDGTLAPIVPDPPAATILPAARSALERLAAAGAGVVIAVLSGRDAADVARRVGVVGARYLGQHGIEHAHLNADDGGGAEPEAALDPELAARGEAPRRIADQVADRLGRPTWLVVELKGASVGLHYRRATDPEAARRAILAALDGIGDLRTPAGHGAPLVTESRRVVELRPAGAFGKGEAARRLIADVHPEAVLVLGDDRTDAEAFEVVRGWRETSNRPALIVGVSGASETPSEVREHADLIVPGPEAAAALLADLATETERHPPAG